MNKLVSFNTFAKSSLLSNTSIVLGEQNTPLGFVFGREAFISLLTTLDEEFEKKVKNPKQAANNSAGKLIDLIEEHLPVNPTFTKEFKEKRESEKMKWIPLEEVVETLHV